MATVPVILSSFDNYTLELPRDALRQYFPNSLLTNAEEKEGPIIISNPVVTPELLRSIQQVLQMGRIMYQPLPKTDLTAAVDYLNMDTLALMQEPQLPLYQFVYPEKN